MNWKYFLMAIGCFALAYMIRRLGKWVDGDAVKNQDAPGYWQAY